MEDRSTVNGKSFGIRGKRAFEAKAPCPISRLVTPPVPFGSSLLAKEGNA